MFDDNCHMGHVILDCMKDRPDAIWHIDAATSEKETNASVLSRSVRLARCLRLLGLVPGDVLALGGRNHIDLHIPYYAAIMNGLPIAGVDPLFKLEEVKTFFKLTAPRIAFCEPEHYNIYTAAASALGLTTRVVTFGEGPRSMRHLMETMDDEPIEAFEPAVFDQDRVYAWLVSSGGTTGVIKVAAIKHHALKEKLRDLLTGFGSRKNQVCSDENRPALNMSPVQWISGFFSAVSMPLLHQTKVQSSSPPTVEHVVDVINKYRPVTGMIGPPLAMGILRSGLPCDFTCFDTIFLTGGKVYTDVLLEIKKRVRKDAVVIEVYGQTENLGPVFIPNPLGPIGNCGVPCEKVQIKLVDPETGREITEPNVTGELWTKSNCFSEYYNDPEATAAALTEDGWYRTGDLLYHDQNINYFFVERMKMLIKYRNYHIVPPELEAVIRSHPGVLEVSVSSVPHAADGEHPVACVVSAPGAAVSAADIRRLVADTLSETKQLRGGVVFMDALPMTSSGKVARARLREMVATAHREY